MAKRASSKPVDNETLISNIVNSLNTDDLNVYRLSESELNPALIRNWVSTGNEIVDVIISNRKNGGIPLGRITEIFGLESTGKSLFAAHILAEVQKMGGIAALIDSEYSISPDFMESIGIDQDQLIYIPVSPIEKIFKAIEDLIEKFRAVTDKPFVICVDSIMNATTLSELEVDYEVKGYNTQKALIIGMAMRKLQGLIANQNVALVFVNQVRTNMNAMFGEKWVTSGGKGIPFSATLRLLLKKLSKIKIKEKGVEKVIGVKTELTVYKSKLGSAHRKVEFDIYFDRGMDSSTSWLSSALEVGVVQKCKSKKGWLRFSDDVDETDTFQAPSFQRLLDDPDRKEKIFNEIAEAYIMKYAGRSTLKDLDKNEISYDETDD